MLELNKRALICALSLVAGGSALAQTTSSTPPSEVPVSSMPSTIPAPPPPPPPPLPSILPPSPSPVIVAPVRVPRAAATLPPPSSDPLSIDPGQDPILQLARSQASPEAFRAVVATAVERHPATQEARATSAEAEAVVDEAQERRLP